MGRGGSGGSSHTGRSLRRRRIANRLRAIETNHRLLKEGMERYPEGDSFAADWVSEEFRPAA